MTTTSHVDPLIGRLVDGRYRVRARIARGGMATVYVATDLRLERRIALKVMHSHLSDDSVFQSKFIQEARSAARLSDPHVVNVYDQGQDGDLAYLVMEYLPGVTLRDLLKQQRRLSVPHTIAVMDAVLSGLSAAHRAGLVHRDVKPENVLLADDGRIKIGDFGLARATSANTATGQQLLGTIAYLAPELVTRGTADARSDIYALGIMLYEMLAGEQPYKGEQPMQIAYQHATESVPRPSVKNPAVPEQLDELVLWSTEKSPDERPADAQEMLARLREIERELGVTVSPTSSSGLGTSAVVVPDGVTSPDERTQVIPDGATALLPPAVTTAPAAAPDAEGNAQALRGVARRRRARGFWAILLTLALAAGAGAAGWWWGTGPGSQVVIPTLTGSSFAAAEGILAEQQLTAIQETLASLDVPAGEVIGSSPEPGTRVDRNTQVTVTVSAGPAEVTIPAVVGMSEQDARAALEQLVIGVENPARSVFDSAEAGTVLAASLTPNGGEAADCSGGCTAHQGDAAQLVVSLGPVPDVSGSTVADARSTLEGIGFTVAENTVQEYNTDVPKGQVMGVTTDRTEGAWRPGDTLTLTESLGPRPITVPDVSGKTIREAVTELQGLGFVVNAQVADGPLPFSEDTTWDLYRVSSTNPAAGTDQLPGTTITLTPRLGF